MDTIDRDGYGTISHEPGLNFLRLDWLPETENMSTDDFKRTLTVLADTAVEKSAEGIMIDVRQFRSSAAREIDDWRLQNIVPKYNSVLKRFAWLAGDQPPDLPGGGEPYQNEGEAYMNRWFRDETNAINWVTKIG